MVPTKRPTGLKPSRRTMSTPLSRPNVTGPTNTHTCLHPLEGQTSIVIHRSGRAETCSEPRGSAYIHPHPSADDGNGTRTSKRPVIHSHSFLAIYIYASSTPHPPLPFPSSFPQGINFPSYRSFILHPDHVVRILPHNTFYFRVVPIITTGTPSPAGYQQH